MPQIIEIDGRPHEVATEDELLEFVNKARAAGGANVLEALLPAVPQEPSACLIAIGLNFNCEVNSIGEYDEYGTLWWEMILPYNIDYELAQEIAKALDCPLGYRLETFRDVKFVPLENDAQDPRNGDGEGGLLIRLPAHIGNAAFAFDERLAFTEYIDESGSAY